MTMYHSSLSVLITKRTPSGVKRHMQVRKQIFLYLQMGLHDPLTLVFT